MDKVCRRKFSHWHNLLLTMKKSYLLIPNQYLESTINVIDIWVVNINLQVKEPVPVLFECVEH